ncbi:uncharacterized protein EAF01_006601 [Botrytis porri]|uniref:Mannose-1-phosphate guanyltransferase C-terminal domain-containing protein n=1 Tax=Botrytis porri TaxID=87229 RepID=A0A4Z1KQI3_9HELO|nr:uncharacterized protein EAF01_006601 [Botrytis porri]KAF7903552.1 hypothetical protein EAF01_006601 [Botrytis porri]TGO83769.1 hypothetical protein BPOR_0595g00050 [Botrytis porri]
MANLPPNIDFDRHEWAAMADFTGQNVYSTSANAYGYANLRIYNKEAVTRLEHTHELFIIHHTVAADSRCHGFNTSIGSTDSFTGSIKISGRCGIIICRPGMISSMVHLNASDEKIILKTGCRIDNDVYIGPGVVIGIGVHVCANVRIAGDTEISNHTNVESGVIIGWNVRIGANVLIGQNVVIGRNVVIGISAVIEMGVVIEDNVRIGTMAKIPRMGRIKAGTKVGDNAIYSPQ